MMMFTTMIIVMRTVMDVAGASGGLREGGWAAQWGIRGRHTREVVEQSGARSRETLSRCVFFSDRSTLSTLGSEYRVDTLFQRLFPNRSSFETSSIFSTNGSFMSCKVDKDLCLHLLYIFNPFKYTLGSLPWPTENVRRINPACKH